MAVFPTDAIPQTTTLQPLPIVTTALKQTNKQYMQTARTNQMSSRVKTKQNRITICTGTTSENSSNLIFHKFHITNFSICMTI